MAIEQLARVADSQPAPKPPPRVNSSKCLTWPTKPMRFNLRMTALARNTVSAGPVIHAASSTRRTPQREWKKRKTQRSLLAPNG